MPRTQGVTEMRKFTLVFLVMAFAALSVFGQTPTLRIVTDDPTLPSDLFYGATRVKPLRLRPGTNTPITIDDSDFFVFYQYVDFLSRMPDQAGQDFWTAQLTACTPQPSCLDRRRNEVSAAFFVEQEYQSTGYFVYKLYRGVLGRFSTVEEFKPDRRQIVGGAQLEASKRAFAAAFIQRPEFQTKYPATLSTAAQFVDAVLATTLTTTGADLSASRTALINAFNDATDGGRARVIREVADNPTLSTREFNRGFVAIQYWGYLQRNFDQAGYDFWVNALNTFPGDAQRAMVCAFITSAEYQLRFGNTVTRTNQICTNLYG
jgi:hypothetical protein